MNYELGRFDLTESWNRSQKFGIDPYRAENEILSQTEVHERKSRLHPLFQYCTPILENLYFQLKNSPFMMIVTDADGYIVSTWGDSPFVDQAKVVSLECGVNWEEKRKGTNAIGTALIEKKTVQVIGEEHYVKENQFLTCYATPLFGPMGEVIGVLDVSGDVRFHHPHTLGMVNAAAHACQSSILLSSVHRELVLTLKESDRITNRTKQPLISLSEEGVIKRINQSAARLLNESVENCIGHSITKWVEKELVHTLLSQKTKSALQLSVKAHTKMSGNWFIEPIFDDRQQMYRLVLTTKESDDRENLVPSGSKEHPVGSCENFQKTLQFAYKVAKTNATILIRGETGTGKEVMAKEIHHTSGRKGPLVTINSGAIPENLLEAELFGYEKGAFTGAKQGGYKGKFVAAHEGTLFLDEIGEMPLTAQVALLRVLEEKRVTPIGSNRSISIDVRIIAATNRDLKKEIAEKRFRADLYYRLCELEILLPPLREREDLLELVAYFAQQMEGDLHLPYKIALDDSAKNLIEQYDWPGNIRELRHMVRQAIYHMLYTRGATRLTKDDFSIMVYEKAQPKLIEHLSIEQSEQETIAKAIQLSEGNLSKAAGLLKMGRTTLYRKINQYPYLKRIRNNY